MERSEFGTTRWMWWRLLAAMALPAGFLYSLGFYPLLASEGTLIAILLLALSIGAVLILRRNRLSMAPFTIHEGVLYVHYGFGEVQEYPISRFEGKIEVRKILFGHYLMAPGYHKGRIPLSLVGAGERNRLIAKLRTLVSNA